MDFGRLGSFVRGAALGAGAAYYLDPASGRRRRARMRDRGDHLIAVTDRFLEGAARDLNNRARGLMCEARALFSLRLASDQVVSERVRARLGRISSHPRAIDVEVANGTVTLSGRVLAHETDRVLAEAASVRGVRSVVNRLESHSEAGSIPELQDGTHPSGDLGGGRQDGWTDGPRLLAIIGGGILAVYGVRRGGLLGAAASASGIGLAVRGGANHSLGSLFGGSADRSAITIQKTANIDAPVEKVFQAFSDYQFYPYFLSNVQEVRDLGNGRSHWVVAGPAGTVVTWDAEITRIVPGREFGWRTSGSGQVTHSGVIQFRANAQGGTQVNIRLSYRPPAGAVGHAAARAVGTDPKSLMDADLARMKTFIETGTPPHDAAKAQSLAA